MKRLLPAIMLLSVITAQAGVLEDFGQKLRGTCAYMPFQKHVLGRIDQFEGFLGQSSQYKDLALLRLKYKTYNALAEKAPFFGKIFGWFVSSDKQQEIAHLSERVKITAQLVRPDQKISLFWLVDLIAKANVKEILKDKKAARDAAEKVAIAAEVVLSGDASGAINAAAEEFCKIDVGCTECKNLKDNLKAIATMQTFLNHQK
ncbi:MAG: hypothetical protein WC707_04445 [Candidatus Babeliaceae bacterium]|jgi:hypothetical protein